MKPPTRQLQVVRENEEHAGDDEGDEAPPDHGDAGHAEGDRAEKAGDRRDPQRKRGDAGSQRASPKLVQRVGRDADREEEGEQGGQQPGQAQHRREGRSDHHVGQMPGRVGRMQQGPHVASPACRGRRVVSRGRRLRDRGHAWCFLPHITSPPPRLITLRSTSTIPAVRQASKI